MLEELSRIDPLTGAANRRHLQDEFEREMARADRTGSSLTLAFLDLDHFKRFNDERGHGAGDVLLVDTVRAWQRALRPTDLLARVGGEEFVVLCPDTDIGAFRAVVERLRALVAFGQTCSAGLTGFEPGETADAFVNRADGALYAAKRAGRDRSAVSDEPHAQNDRSRQAGTEGGETDSRDIGSREQ